MKKCPDAEKGPVQVTFGMDGITVTPNPVCVMFEKTLTWKFDCGPGPVEIKFAGAGKQKGPFSNTNAKKQRGVFAKTLKDKGSIRTEKVDKAPRGDEKLWKYTLTITKGETTCTITPQVRVIK